MFALVTLIIECLILAGLRSLRATELSDALVIFIIIFFSAAYVFSLFSNKRLKDVRMPLLCGYLWRIALLLLDIYGRAIYVLPNAAGDAEGFYYHSAAIARGLEKSSEFGFSTVMGGFFSQVGVSRLLGQFLILLYSVVAIHAAVWILNELEISGRAKKRSMYILCLLPNFAILSIAFLRESIVTMFASLSLFFFVRWYKTKNEAYFLGAFALVFCGAAFHSGVTGLAAGYIVARMLYDNTRRRLRLSIKGVVFSAVFLVAFVYLFNNYSETLFGKMQSMEDLEDVANVNNAGGSSYAAYVGNSNNPANMVIFTVPRIVFFLFSPFPWQWRGLADIIAFCFSSMFYLYTVYRSGAYLASGEKENRNIIIILLILAACTVFVFAWGVSNTGTAARHRDKMVVLYAILYAVTPMRKKIKRREMRSGGAY